MSPQGVTFMDLVRTRSNSFSPGVQIVNVAQGVCMATLRVGMPLEAWPSSLLTQVSSPTSSTPCIASHSFHHSEMLTPIDQPLDKLLDLRPDEMYVYPFDMCTCPDLCSSAKT